jgi:hypothetical protein
MTAAVLDLMKYTSFQPVISSGAFCLPELARLKADSAAAG